MFLLSLLIAGQTSAWCFSVPKRSRTFKSTRMGAFLLTLLPLLWATRVAVSRIQDYVRASIFERSIFDNFIQRHHAEDVVVGSIIGVICALLCYLIYWPSPFSTSNFSPGTYGQPRCLYKDEIYSDTYANEIDLEADI